MKTDRVNAAILNVLQVLSTRVYRGNRIKIVYPPLKKLVNGGRNGPRQTLQLSREECQELLWSIWNTKACLRLNPEVYIVRSKWLQEKAAISILDILMEKSYVAT